MNTVKYKYREPALIREIHSYIDSTYTQHYTKDGNTQVTEFIVQQRNSYEFLIGCAMKYTARYGKKEGFNKKDLLKAIHTLIQALHYHYEFHESSKEEIVIPQLELFGATETPTNNKFPGTTLHTQEHTQ
jgi:hypothetical protein